jgi:intraflagellar transport protein 43
MFNKRESERTSDGVGPLRDADSEPQAPAEPQTAGRSSSSRVQQQAAAPLMVEVLSREDGKKFAGVSRRKQEQEVQQQEQQAAKLRSKYLDRAQEMIDIPELEEEGKEDLTRVVRGKA